MVAQNVDFECLWDYVLIERIVSKTTAGGIVLPEGETSAEEMKKARVIKCGPGGLNRDGERLPMPVKEGDVVYLITRGQIQGIKLNGREYGVVRAMELVAKAELDS
jgi:chaperonin GroES